MTTLKSSVEQKIFFEKKTPCNRHQKISTTVFWRIRPKLAFQKSVKTPIKKKVFVGFFGNCLRMQKPKIKFTKFGHWDMALVCGPGSRKHSPLPQNRPDAQAKVSKQTATQCKTSFGAEAVCLLICFFCPPPCLAALLLSLPTALSTPRYPINPRQNAGLILNGCGLAWPPETAGLPAVNLLFPKINSFSETPSAFG